MKLLCVTLNLLFFIHSVYSQAVSISAKFDDAKLRAVYQGDRKQVELECNVNVTDNLSTSPVEWQKDGKPLSLNDTRFKPSREGSVSKLTIKGPKDEDFGNYTCIVFQSNKSRAGSDWISFSKGTPLKIRPMNNQNAVQGETLRIHCTFHGEPPPTVYWIYANETFSMTYNESSERVHLDEDTEKKLPNAIFRINEVDMYDRGNYTCVGTSEVWADVNSTCFVRIKDKYAPLWPFLGICAEVFILCAIIFIYEKKRNKTELEESDTDQSPDQKNTPDHGKDSNLRHRQ